MVDDQGFAAAWAWLADEVGGACGMLVTVATPVTVRSRVTVVSAVVVTKMVLPGAVVVGPTLVTVTALVIVAVVVMTVTAGTAVFAPAPLQPTEAASSRTPARTLVTPGCRTRSR